MDLESINNLINTLSSSFLVISPTVFVFSVTLLGAAIEQTEQEEKTARENDKANIQGEIDLLQTKINDAKKNGNMSALTDELEQLKTRQWRSEKKFKEIKTKYSRIDFTNTVLLPCSAFIFALVLTPVGIFLKEISIVSQILSVILQAILILYGSIRILLSLSLVQEISAKKKESDVQSRLKETIKLALQEHGQSGVQEVSLTFVDKEFPLNTTVSTELDIKFRIKLTKGSMLENVAVWFFVADGIDLISPSEASSWKQDADYSPPNIRTAKIAFGRLSVGPYISSHLKIKTPATPGKYLLRYKVYGDGYTSSQKDLIILVG